MGTSLLYLLFLFLFCIGLFFVLRKVIYSKRVYKKVQSINDRMYEFPDEVKAMLVNDPALLVFRGAISGVGVYSVNVIATATRVIVSSRKPTGIDIFAVPYSQLINVNYTRRKQMLGTCPFTITAQSREITVNSMSRDAPIQMIHFLHEKVSDITGVFTEIAHNETLMSESWEFKTPNLVAFGAGKQNNSPNTHSDESIPDQIKKLADLNKAGILTNEEFESKKSELLKRI